MNIGGQIPWNATPSCETFKISYLMGKPHMRFHLVHWLSNPISAKDQSRIHQFGEKVFLTWFVPRIRFVRGVNLEG